SLLGAAVISAGNTLAPFLAVEVLRRLGFHHEIDRLRDAMALIGVGALGAMTISATVGTSVLALSGSIPASNFWVTWAVWWTGDAMGVLLVAPFLLSLLYGPKLVTISWGRAVELLALLAATGVAAYLLFQNPLGIQYLVVPLIVLAAWRFRMRGAAPVALIASGVAIWAAINHTGPFSGESLLKDMVTLQVFNVTVAAVSFLLAGYIQAHERQEEMARLYAGAKAASEAKTQFLHMAAHELRTPISVVTGYLALMGDGSLGPVPDRWRRPLEVLAAKAEELNSIVTDLLEASRIEANALPLHLQLVDLRSIVQAAGDRSKPRAHLMGGEIVLRLSEEPVMVEADPPQLGRVLDNLINNGLTYTLREPWVLMDVCSKAGQALVRVSDNGAGIPEDDRERIFDQFYRSNDPAFRMAAGTGLGLFIARELARRHGGRLVVESSRLEEGSIFALTLPLASAERGAVGPVADNAGGVEELVTIS
ncbi:MAG TPA: MASE1 domain-containing protein, partial [Candidatus Dormibacteraeota bacterium]|nr:MASE1 domain-containing protein [Candidatus Dormibacteraeota bacterium]